MTSCKYQCDRIPPCRNAPWFHGSRADSLKSCQTGGANESGDRWHIKPSVRMGEFNELGGSCFMAPILQAAEASPYIRIRCIILYHWEVECHKQCTSLAGWWGRDGGLTKEGVEGCCNSIKTDIVQVLVQTFHDMKILWFKQNLPTLIQQHLHALHWGRVGECLRLQGAKEVHILGDVILMDLFVKTMW